LLSFFLFHQIKSKFYQWADGWTIPERIGTCEDIGEKIIILFSITAKSRISPFFSSMDDIDGVFEPSFSVNGYTGQSSSSSRSGWFETKTAVLYAVIVILVLAFAGFNVFVYLAKGTQDISNFFGPLAQRLMGGIAMVTGQTVAVSSEGAKTVVTNTSGALNTGLSAIQMVSDPTGPVANKLAQSSLAMSDSTTTGQVVNDPIANTNLNQSIQTARTNINGGGGDNRNGTMDYQANDAASSLYAGSLVEKAGWCFVGQDRGFRSCMQVGVGDQCMSGDIFPTQEICINPSLRQ